MAHPSLRWNLLFIPLAFALMGQGCPQSAPFPSYAGIYTLESVTYMGSDETFPFESAAPPALSVTQDILQASSGRAVTLVVSNADTGELIMDSKLDSHGNFASTSGRLDRAILAPLHVSDTTSTFLGFGLGYACAFAYGADINAQMLNPSPHLLMEAYPSCVDEPTTRGTVCVGRRDRAELPVLTEAWRQAGDPRLIMTLTAFKTQTNSPEFCSKPGAFAQMTLVYTRAPSAAVESIDLRMSREEATAEGLTADLTTFRAAADGAPAMLGLPASAEDLRRLWPMDNP